MVVKYFTYIMSVLIVPLAVLNGCKKVTDTNTPASTASISGNIAPSGAAKSIVAVPLAATCNKQANLDSSNSFSIAGLAAGSYKICFAAMPGFTAPDTVTVTVKAGENLNIGTVKFKVFIMTGSISGKITPSGAAKSIVAVSLADTGNTQAKLDSSNGFSIAGLTAGSYKIGFAAMPGFAVPDSVSVAVKAGENVDIGLISFRRDSAKGSISGTIRPLKAATVITATNLQSNIAYTTVPDTVFGAFTFVNLDTGAYKISFTSPHSYLAPADITVTVADRQNSNAGNVVFTALTGIFGMISPAGTGDLLIYYVSTFKTYEISPDATTGAFQSGALPVGDYRLSFRAIAGYRPPPSVNVTVTTDQRIDIGTFVMKRNSLSGTPFYSQNSPFLDYLAPNLKMSSYQSNPLTGSSKTFTIVMDSITMPGTYVCKNTTISNITYATKNSAYSPAITWSTTNAGGSGTVVVTSIDTVKKEIAGTFTATLTNASNANVVINNGSFDFVYQ